MLYMLMCMRKPLDVADLRSTRLGTRPWHVMLGIYDDDRYVEGTLSGRAEQDTRRLQDKEYNTEQTYEAKSY